MDVRKCEYFESKQKLLNEWDDLIKKEEKLKGKTLSDIQECFIAEKLAFQYIKKHPVLFLAVYFSKIIVGFVYLFSKKIVR